MKKTLFCLSLAAMFAACNNSSDAPLQVNADTLTTTVKPMAGDSVAKGLNCYAYINNKDTIRLQYEVVNEKVTGKLLYNYFEKDKNSGTIAGFVTPTGIVADYTFNAEGTTSVREVVFKKVDGGMVEGYGEIREDGAKPVFVNKEALKYDDKFTLTAAACF